MADHLDERVARVFDVFDDIQVPVCDRVKAAGVNRSSSHRAPTWNVRASFARLRLSMRSVGSQCELLNQRKSGRYQRKK